MQNPKRRKPMNHHRTAPATLGAKLRPVEVDRQRPKAARSLRWTRAGAQPLTVFKSMSGAMNPKMTSQMAGIAPRNGPKGEGTGGLEVAPDDPVPHGAKGHKGRDGK